MDNVERYALVNFKLIGKQAFDAVIIDGKKISTLCK